MNGKKAKALRKQAEGKTINKPVVAYEKLQPYLVGILPQVAMFSGHVRMTKDCTRHAYQQLKREYRQQARA